jgi:hypothetical protein
LHRGYRIRSGQVRAGTKARERLSEPLRAVAAGGDLDAVRATIISYAAVWRFGPSSGPRRQVGDRGGQRLGIRAAGRRIRGVLARAARLDPTVDPRPRLPRDE